MILSNKILKALFLLLFNVITSLIYAEQKNISVEEFTQKQGLPQGYVTGIVQDKSGFLWISTKLGLSRYDGYTFVNYQHNPKDSNSISSNFIRSMYIDSKNYLWIISYEGQIDVVDLKIMRFYKVKGPSEVKYVYGYFIQSKNPGTTVLRINDLFYTCNFNVIDTKGEFIKLPFKIKLNMGDVLLYKPQIDEFKNLIIRETTSVGDKFSLYNIEANIKTELYQSDIKHGSIVHYLNQSKVIYFTDRNSHFLYFCETNQIKQIQLPKESNCFHTNGLNNLWFVVNDKMVLVNVNNNDFKIDFLQVRNNIEIKYFLKNNISFEDKNGNIFIGSQGHGILKIFSINYPFQSFKFNTRVSVFGFKYHHHNTMIMYENGYELYDTKTRELKLMPLHNELKNIAGPNSFYNFIVKNNLFYLFYQNGKIIEYNPENRKYKLIAQMRSHQYYPDEVKILPNNHICIYYFLENNLYLSYLNEQFKEIKNIRLSTKKIVNYHHVIYESALVNSKDIYVATKIGLIQIDTKTWSIQNLSDKEVILSENIISLHFQKEKNKLWLGTEGEGLVEFDILSKKTKTYTMINGLPDNVIYGILQNNNELWLSTNKGLSQMSLDKFSFYNYRIEDGLQDNEFNRRCYAKMNDSMFLFGGINGFNLFNPLNFKSFEIPLKIGLTAIKINNKEIALSLVNRKDLNSYELNLNSNENNIQLNFAVFDYLEPNSNTFKYRISNSQDTNWNYLGNIHQLNFSSLKSGKYKIEILGANSRGQMVNSPIVIDLKIATPWYKTWWAFVLFSGILIAIFYSIFRYRIIQLQKFYNLRTQISADLHDDVGSSLSSVSIYNSLIRKQIQGEYPQAIQLLDKNKEIVSEVMDNLSDIVWAINPVNDKALNVFDRITQQISPLIYDAGFQLNLSIEDKCKDLNLSVIQRKNLYLIVKEIVNNSLKYSKGNEIEISLWENNKKLKVIVSDNGIGFNIKEIQQGNGLNNIKKRIEELNGELRIQSDSNNGTSFNFHFNIA